MTDNAPLRVTLLLGGESGERAVSIHSGLAVAAALDRLGHAVRLLDPATSETRPFSPAVGVDELSALLEAGRPDRGRVLPSLASLGEETDLVANILHGGAGEGGIVAAALELAAIPYFGSGPAAAALAMDKVLAKRLLATKGVPVPRELLWGASTRRASGVPLRPGAPPPVPAPAELEPLGGYPLIAKPICGGSTIGVTILRGPDDWPGAWQAAGEEIDPERGLLVEEFIPGRELTVGVLDDQALPVVEIVPRTGFYDYRRKYTKGETEYRCPADLPEELSGRLRAWGLAAFAVLGCRDFGRADFRLAPDGRVACLEVNTIPGMTELSLLPKAAAAAGVPFDALVERLVRLALARCRRPSPRGTAA